MDFVGRVVASLGGVLACIYKSLADSSFIGICVIACSMENEDPDFQIPCSKKPKRTRPWLLKSALTDNEMKTVMKGHVPLNTKKKYSLGFELFLCTEAGFDNKTNHHLRATGTSAMFRANVPEKIIQKTTVHRSIDALRSYERISEEQHRAVSKVMMMNTEYEGAHSGLRTEIQFQEDRLVQYNAGTTESLGTLFGDLTNWTIGSLTVNVRPIFNAQSTEKVDKEFDEPVQHADFDY